MIVGGRNYTSGEWSAMTRDERHALLYPPEGPAAVGYVKSRYRDPALYPLPTTVMRKWRPEHEPAVAVLERTCARCGTVLGGAWQEPNRELPSRAVCSECT